MKVCVFVSECVFYMSSGPGSVSCWLQSFFSLSLSLCCSWKRSCPEEDLHTMDESTPREGLLMPSWNTQSGETVIMASLSTLSYDRAASWAFHSLAGWNKTISFIGLSTPKHRVAPLWPTPPTPSLSSSVFGFYSTAHTWCKLHNNRRSLSKLYMWLCGAALKFHTL